jgi:hypothetical protein
MADTWITDIRHFLNEKGELPFDIPRPALNLATHLMKIIESTTNRRQLYEESQTIVPCRRRPNHVKCDGYIISSVQEDSRIRWFCPSCGDSGYISGWQFIAWHKK